MKTEKNILIAFLLNLFFCIFEFFGGIFTGSVAILSDSVHDFGDAISIGLSYIFERKSKKAPDENYSYGYMRYSVLGGLITTIVLIIGSLIIMYNAVERLFNPVEIKYQGMIIIAIIGFIFNFLAAYFTKDGDSINQKSVNLHMLEDVLGWIIVLIGAIIMNITNINIIDPVLSIIVSIFILYHAIKNLKKVLDIFFIKTPENINLKQLKENLLKIKGIEDVHHIHVWSIDGEKNYATMHIVTKVKNEKKLKEEIRKKLNDFGICHSILETEEEICDNTSCEIKE